MRAVRDRQTQTDVLHQPLPQGLMKDVRLQTVLTSVPICPSVQGLRWQGESAALFHVLHGLFWFDRLAQVGGGQLADLRLRLQMGQGWVRHGSAQTTSIFPSRGAGRSVTSEGVQTDPTRDFPVPPPLGSLGLGRHKDRVGWPSVND